MQTSFDVSHSILAAEQALKFCGIKYHRQASCVHAHEDLDLSKERLSILPDLSRVVVDGNFFCDDNQTGFSDLCANVRWRQFFYVNNLSWTFKGFSHK